MVIETLEAPVVTRSDTIIAAAMRQIAERRTDYRLLKKYYDGDQPLAFASGKYRDQFQTLVRRFRENLCPAVVDAIADRLTVTGIGLEGAPEGDTTAADIWDLWRSNRMDLRSGEVHQEAIREGDGYVIVWPGMEDGAVRIWPQLADEMTAHYDGETEVIDWAAKYWSIEDGRCRLNLYFADRIEKYVTKTKPRGVPKNAAEFDAWTEEPYVDNPYEQVPVFHFANNAGPASFGRSDLLHVLPLQDALNKSVADMLVAMEHQALPQRWATGLQVEIDPTTGKPKNDWQAGADKVWTSQDVNVRFGQFDAANLDQLLHVQNRFKNGIADVTGIPTHYLQMSPTSWPSGESLKTAEARFVAKIDDRQVAFGNVWEDVLTFAAKVASIELAGRLTVTWQESSPRSDHEMAELAILKKQVGVSDAQNLKELGYSDEEITAMQAEREAASAAVLERQQQLMNRGGEDEEE